MGNNCFNKGGPLDPGAVLDQVVASATAAEECITYHYANFKKGGLLIDTFNKGGSKEVENLIQNQLGYLMYNSGKGEVITRTEYLRWKYRNNTKDVQIALGKQDGYSKHDPLALWEDHEACWKMQHRGSLGESLLHILIMCDTLVHTRIARLVLQQYPRLAVDKIEGEEYLGATGLHLAIAYGNDELAQCIIECGTNVSARALGTFFLPEDQQHSDPSEETDYEGLAYLGEYPLSWASCTANESIYNLLLEKGADPDAQDSFGNTVLHMVVVTNQMGMFGYALKHPTKSANQYITNNADFTCLTLSCQLGRDCLFKEMLELSCTEFWRYSNICCSAYPLGALDSIRPNGDTNWGSAMMIILAGTKEEHLNMLEGGIIAKLLEEKWTTFAQLFFIKRMSKLIIHLLSITISVYSRPDIDESLLNGLKEGTEDITSMDITRYCFEIATIIAAIAFLFIEQGEEIKNSGIESFWRNLVKMTICISIFNLTKGTPPKFIYLVSNFLFLGCIPARLVQFDSSQEEMGRKVEEGLLAWAVPGSWFYMTFFAGAIPLTGPFVTMIYSMILGDMTTFSIIYIIFMFGFSQSFYFITKSHEDPGLFGDYHTTWIGLFHMTLGEYDYDKLSDTAYPGMAKSMFVLFQILIPILLLNMLIAMMGNTYAIVNEKSEKEFLKQWAKIIMSMERSVPPETAKTYLEEYSIKLSKTERGVMVIKTKDKTRASQRKGALSNWKKTGKTVIKYLKKRKMTGDDLRREMWVHDVAETPKAARKKKGLGYDVGGAPVANQDDDLNQTGSGPAGDVEPANSSCDPHLAPRLKPRKSRDQLQMELYLKKRSRKNMKTIPELDVDGLPFEPSEESDSGDETFLVATSREIHKSGQFGYINSGFDTMDETKQKKKKDKKKRQKSDEDCILEKEGGEEEQTPGCTEEADGEATEAPAEDPADA